MTYKPYKAHTNATGGGRLGRILQIVHLESLPPALLRECLRDLVASIVSVADAAGALLNYLDLAVVGELQANAPASNLAGAYQELAP